MKYVYKKNKIEGSTVALAAEIFIAFLAKLYDSQCSQSEPLEIILVIALIVSAAFALVWNTVEIFEEEKNFINKVLELFILAFLTFMPALLTVNILKTEVPIYFFVIAIFIVLLFYALRRCSSSNTDISKDKSDSEE